jgi:GTP-binding protein
MRIRSLECVAQAFTPGQLPASGLPEVAVFGRSNVGKSSLLGALMGRSRMARISSTPGKTRGIFIYLVNGVLLLADLPGYGFSRAPRDETSTWRPLLEAYLDRGDGPALALRLLDVRHPPTAADLLVGSILSQRDIPSLIVATKTDKFSRGALPRALASLARSLSVPVEAIVPFSVKQGADPVRILWSRVDERLAGRRMRRTQGVRP